MFCRRKGVIVVALTARVPRQVDLFPRHIDHFPRQVIHFPRQIDRFPRQIDRFPGQIDRARYVFFCQKASIARFGTTDSGLCMNSGNMDAVMSQNTRW